MKAWKAILVVILLAIALLYIENWLFPRKKPQPEIITHTDTIPGDSIPYAVEVKVPVPVASVPETLYRDQPVDTAAILADYHTRHEYRDTLKNDTSALIVLGETTFKNRIVDRSLMFQNRRPTVINTTTTIFNPPAPAKWYLLAGLSAGSLKGKAQLGPAAGVVSPNQSVFTYSYDMLNEAHAVTLLCNPFRRQKVPP